MSAGEQQMLAIARALMSEPRILLIDEPSVGLAPILVSRVIAKIRELKERRNLTVLMAEQNFNQAIKIADRGYIIVHGEIASPRQPPPICPKTRWSSDTISAPDARFRPGRLPVRWPARPWPFTKCCAALPPARMAGAWCFC